MFGSLSIHSHKYRFFTSLLLSIFLLTVCTSFHSTKIMFGYKVVIAKHAYELSVYNEEGWLATYPCVFGNNDLRDKMVSGDRKTPIGEYKIVSKNPNSKWSRFMLLDYPNAADRLKFEQRKSQGLIPADAKIGNGIGIHGTWKNDDFAVDSFQNWTDGCISLKNVHIEELFNMLPVGTPVIIQE